MMILSVGCAPSCPRCAVALLVRRCSVQEPAERVGHLGLLYGEVGHAERLACKKLEERVGKGKSKRLLLHDRLCSEPATELKELEEAVCSILGLLDLSCSLSLSESPIFLGHGRVGVSSSLRCPACFEFPDTGEPAPGLRHHCQDLTTRRVDSIASEGVPLEHARTTLRCGDWGAAATAAIRQVLRNLPHGGDQYGLGTEREPLPHGPTSIEGGLAGKLHAESAPGIPWWHHPLADRVQEQPLRGLALHD
mmetsp:Transcript_14225/g.41939  ORF Transcript_14225/g.41939 Transcript_14225/m.41939 type:complete len:250 (-) Transcript_14225:1678-2427(-)